MKMTTYINITFISVVLSAVCFLLYVNYETPEPCPPFNMWDEPILTLDFDGWAENIEDSSKMIYTYFITNYGNAEAKNVVVSCIIYDSNGEEIKRDIAKGINIPSQTSSYEESYGEDVGGETATCYIKSCDNCQLLWKNLPVAVENFGI